MTLMAAFQVMLARLSGQDDVVVGFPAANRSTPELDGLIGFFVNTLALRVDLSGNPSFDELLGRVRQAALEAYNHQDVPFEQIVEDIVPQRDLARTPIFQAMLALLDDPLGELDLPGLAASPLDVPVSTTRFDLVLDLEEEAGGDSAEPSSSARICLTRTPRVGWPAISGYCSTRSLPTRPGMSWSSSC